MSQLPGHTTDSQPAVETIAKYLSSLKIVASVIVGLVLLGMAVNVYVSKFALGSDLAEVRRETQTLKEQFGRTDERLKYLGAAVFAITQKMDIAVPPPP